MKLDEQLFGCDPGRQEIIEGGIFTSLDINLQNVDLPVAEAGLQSRETVDRRFDDFARRTF